jgi:hypothetical protein
MEEEKTPIQFHPKLTSCIVQISIMLETCRKESYPIAHFLDTHCTTHVAYHFHLELIRILGELNRYFTGLDPLDTPLQIHHTTTMLLYLILTMVNVATSSKTATTPINESIYQIITSSTALFMYNRSLLTPQNRASAQRHLTARNNRILAKYGSEQFYVNMRKNPEILLAPNHYPQSPTEIRVMHHDIMAAKLHHHWLTHTIPEPPTTPESFPKWLKTFADCHKYPDFPITQAVRLILRDHATAIPPLQIITKPQQPLLIQANPTSNPNNQSNNQTQTPTQCAHMVFQQPAQAVQMAYPIPPPHDINHANFQNPQHHNQYAPVDHAHQQQQAVYNAQIQWRQYHEHTLQSIHQQLQQLLTLTQQQSETFQKQLTVIHEIVNQTNPN